MTQTQRKSQAEGIPGRIPVAFISSTSDDLKACRNSAKEACLAANFFPRMMEYFPAGGNPPLEECLSKISGSPQHPPADLLIVIVAYRYGWVPDDQPGSEAKSITWMECLHAHERSKELLVFLVDEKAEWPEEHKEEFRLVSALRDGSIGDDLVEEVQSNVAGLKDFKKWLSNGRIRETFTDADDLSRKILSALQDWLSRHPKSLAALENYLDRHPEAAGRGDPSHYLRALRKETASIDIRGLQVDSGKAGRFPIEDLYITLRTSSAQQSDRKSKQRPDVIEGRVASIELEQALKHPRLAVIGDPGSGKTTFLRRICQLACRSRLDEDAEALKSLGLEKAPFPILIRLSELEEHRTAHTGQPNVPTPAASPQWLAHFLASQWSSEGLNADFFEKRFKDGSALLLLDGLDEAPDERRRASLVRLIEGAADRWEDCRLVVTSRSATYQGESVLSGFAHASIEALGDEAIRTFLGHWCRALFPNEPERAAGHLEGLSEALRSRIEIRRMARNPVMLTALAVVHWNEKRIPEQRVDLYESILTWLSRSRQQLPHRVSPERSLGLLQSLALAMHDHPKGRRVQVPRRWAAEAIAPAWRESPESERIAAAEKFLEEEEKDSGIVVRRGSEIRFWHLTFQEYLAARALAGLTDEKQHERVQQRLYEPEWREAVLLLAGFLHGLGIDRVDSLFTAALDELGEGASLRDQARCAGLLGAVLRDLKPLQYQVADSRYESVLNQVLAIFDRERSQGIPIPEAIEAAEALGQAGDPRFDEWHLEKNWVEIPAGEFLMGAQDTDPDGPNFDPEIDSVWPEGPVHRVRLDAYRIGRYPVTVGEYRRFIEAGGYRDENYWRDGGLGQWTEPVDWEEQSRHPNRPVVGVSWFEAAAYARWRGAELPTEAQWERAARGRSGRRYPWGDDPEPEPSFLNFFESQVNEATPVGVHPQGSTPDGIADLAGNVWEWCRDRYGPYAEGAAQNPTGPETSDRRVLRGGAWFNLPEDCRSSDRDGHRPSLRSELNGFRLVLFGSSAGTEKRES